MIGIIISLTVVIIILIIVIFSIYKNYQNLLITSRNKINELNNLMQEKDKKYQENISQLNESKDLYYQQWQAQLTSNAVLQHQLTTALQNNENAEKALSSRYNALTENVAAAEQQLEQLNNQIKNRTNELNTVAAAFTEVHNQLLEASTSRSAAASELTSYQLQLAAVLKELDDAKLTQRGTTLNAIKNEQNWFDFDMSNKEIKLISTIAEISSLYPELTKDLATIEWKKIWLPKFQDLANANGLNTRGIYRLVLKEDENISYVGQAINIKDRWYEHAKKMIGADTKGTEKVYRYRPEDFYWTVLEMGTDDLDTAEKYWIEYYCCKEIGLNKRI